MAKRREIIFVKPIAAGTKKVFRPYGGGGNAPSIVDWKYSCRLECGHWKTLKNEPKRGQFALCDRCAEKEAEKC